MDKEQVYKDVLKQSGERLSTPRIILFRALLSHSPISSVKLIEQGKKSGIDPATTYRTLTLFRRLGIARDIMAGDKRLIELSDDYAAHHHHFLCRKCGRLIDFDSKTVETSLGQAIEEMGADMTSHHIEISGLCADCRKS